MASGSVPFIMHKQSGWKAAVLTKHTLTKGCRIYGRQVSYKQMHPKAILISIKGLKGVLRQSQMPKQHWNL